MDFATAVRYPMNEDNWVKTLGIGTILKLLSGFVVPWLILQGYYTEVIRTTIQGDTEPPEFEDWAALLADGTKATVIHGVYLFVPVLLFFAMVVPTLSAMVSGDIGILAGLTGLLGSLLITALVFAVFLYAASAAHMVFAYTGRMRSAFTTDVITVAASRQYVAAHLGSLVVLGTAALLKTIIAAIPIVHFLLLFIAPFLVKYSLTVSARLYGQAAAENLVSSPASAPTPAQPQRAT